MLSAKGLQRRYVEGSKLKKLTMLKMLKQNPISRQW